jgi:integrase
MTRYKLTDAQLRTASSGDLYDGDGLFLRVKVSGTKSWMYQWTAVPGEKPRRPKMGLGPYPLISLARARDKADHCRALLAEGIDPRQKPEAVAAPETFKEAAEKLLELKRDALKRGGEAGRWMSTLEHHVFPIIGDNAVVELTLDDLVRVLEPIWKREIGRKAINKIDQVLTSAKARNSAVLPDVTDGITKSLKALLPQVRRKNVNHPALPWEQMPALWMALGDSVAHMALKFYLLNIPRASNVTKAVWGEIDWEECIWDIPETNTKSGIAFAAPLATQSIVILREMQKQQPATGKTDKIFASSAAWKKGAVSENTWGKWLDENDWKAADGRAAVAHGFRATFGTWSGDNDICEDKMKERCIQHTVDSVAAAAYLRSQLLRQRLLIMQQWADFVTSDAVKADEARALAAAQRAKLDGIVDSSGQTLRDVEQWARGSLDDDAEARALDEDAVARKREEQASMKSYHYDQEK